MAWQAAWAGLLGLAGLTICAQADVTFDCEQGKNNWKEGWSDKKKEYCCQTASIGCENNEDPPAPPPPPPPAVPPVQVSTGSAAPVRKLQGPQRKEDGMPYEVHEYENPDHHIDAWRERHLSTMKATQHHHTRGSWLYGQLGTAEGVKDPVSCANACEERNDCYHWMFHVTGHHCGLAHDHGFPGEDAGDWIHGHSKRYLNKPQTAGGVASEL
eukprot:TRINITY_DN111033_c0_g1_i1.p1 TRINITY_DN111033_c0_g1~~TRINITY_DN111033_c0_g1_i1.p1  ORF type:complete len:213 (+),score=30.07 TRINITY_DN111033_c0_g1_i1:78-716(+)